MDEGKRKFMKMLPLAAASGIAMTVGQAKGEMVETRSDKKYVFRINNGFCTQEDLENIKRTLLSNGYSPDTLVIAGPVEIFEVA